MELAVEVDGEGIPQLRFPEPFNVAEYFIDRHMAEGRAGKVAIRTLRRDVTYAELIGNVNRFGNALFKLGIVRGERQDTAIQTADRPAGFLKPSKTCNQR